MEIVPFEPSLREPWDALNKRARNGHFMFDRNFMEYHADRFQDASLMAFDAGGPVALLAANVRGDEVFSHQGLTFGGLVNDDGRATEVLEILEACAAYWQGRGLRRLVYKPLPWIYHSRPAQEDLYWLFRRQARLVRRDLTSAIRMERPGSISKRRSRGARKAEQAGLRSGPSSDLPAFWQVLTETLQSRHGVAPVHSLDEITLLAGRFPEAISLFACNGPDGQMLAGTLLFQTPEVVHAQYIAASPEGRELGALDQVFLAALAACEGRCSYFDFGVSNERDARLLNEGLLRQKEEFGASGVVHDAYEVDLA